MSKQLHVSSGANIEGGVATDAIDLKSVPTLPIVKGDIRIVNNNGVLSTTTDGVTFTAIGAGAITTAAPLSGDGTAGTPATVAAGALTNASLATMAANTFKGSVTGTGAPIDMTATQAKTSLAIANTDVSGLGTLSTQSGTFSGTSSGTNTGDQTITLTGNVTGTGTGSFAATIGAAQVVNSMLDNMAANTIKGNYTGSPAAPTDGTATTVTAFLNPATTSLQGAQSPTDCAQLIGLRGSVVTVAGSAVQDITVSSLTGDTDGGYEIEGNILTAGVGYPTFYLNFNGSTPTGARSAWFFIVNSTGVLTAQVSETDLNIGSISANLDVQNCAFRIRVGSKQGLVQFFKADSFSARANGTVGWTVSSNGQFKMGAQITSVSVHSNVASSIDIGSYIRVRKLGFGE